MPTLNKIDLISAALRSGQLIVTPDAIEFPAQSSSRFKKEIARELFPDQQSTVLERFEQGGKVKIPHSDIDSIHEQSKYSQVLERRLEREQATEALKKAWERSGGNFSPLGLPLPLDPTSKISEIEPGKWVLQCRSGQVQYFHQTRETITIRKHEVTVRLVAIECQVRQESSDEVYGVISVHGPANQLIHSVRVPGSKTLSMGEKGARLVFPNMTLMDGIPAENLHIRVAWIENDNGNVEDIVRQVTAKLNQCATTVSCGLTGFEAERLVVDNQDPAFYEASLWVVCNVLGMGGDAYPVNTKFISAEELMAGVPLQPAYRRNDDSRPVERWTHDLVVQGTDDAGDCGSYRFFFDVFQKSDTVPY